MDKPLAPIHHSILINAQARDGSVAWSMEFTVFRSRNGFLRRSELTAIIEKRDPLSGSYQRKVVRSLLPFAPGLSSPDSLATETWTLEDIRSAQGRFSGSTRTGSGDFNWDLSLPGGHALEFSPLPGWVTHNTLSTQIPAEGSWKLGDWEWNSSATPVRMSLHLRSDVARIAPSVRFHSQFLTDTTGALVHCAEGIHLKPRLAGLGLLPALTSISAFERLKGRPEFSLWRALRASIKREGRGWTFRCEQDGNELRGKIEVEPKHWVTLRCEDVRGSAFYRTSTRLAQLEILVLSAGKPQGHFRSGYNTWVEWTSTDRPTDSPEIQ